MKLLVDHNPPPRLAQALNTIFEPEDEIIALGAKFGRHNLKDEEWIPTLGREGGWAVLSADLNIARKRPSRELFVRAGLVGFFFQSSHAEMAAFSANVARTYALATDDFSPEDNRQRRFRSARERK